MTTDKDKREFLRLLKISRGIISIACEGVGVSRGTYYNWRDSDPDFAREAQEIMDIQGDFVEAKLLQQIEQGDTTAIIFYCKTKLKSRGYNERNTLKQEVNPYAQKTNLLEASPEAKKQIAQHIDAQKIIKDYKLKMTKLLKKQNKYAPELDLQIDIAAQLMAKTKMLSDEIFADSHKAINVEISREGNERQSVNQKEKLFLEYSQQAQRALRALGMNNDAKDKKSEGDSLGDFLSQFSDDDN